MEKKQEPQIGPHLQALAALKDLWPVLAFIAAWVFKAVGGDVSLKDALLKETPSLALLFALLWLLFLLVRWGARKEARAIARQEADDRIKASSIETVATVAILHEQYAALSARADTRVEEERDRQTRIQGLRETVHDTTVSDLNLEIAALSDARNVAQADARKQEALLYYGASLEEIPPLDPHSFAAMMHSVQKLTPLLESLDTTSDAMWAFVKTESCRQPESSPIAWLRVYVENFELRYAVNARNELATRLANGRDPRAILGRWYVAYRTWREALGRLAASLGKQLVEVSGYNAWRTAEVELATVLKTELAPDAFRFVRERVRMFDSTNGALADPPPLLSTAAFGEYGSVVRRLASTTPDEDRFLALFCEGALAMIPERHETWLELAVYHAGEKLLADGVLTRKVGDDGKPRFSLTDIACRAWMSSDRGHPAIRCVTVDPRAVFGTRASGSITGTPYIEQVGSAKR